MIDIQILLLGVVIGCAISRYFIGVGNKISINAQDGVTIDKKQKPTEQNNTD